MDIKVTDIASLIGVYGENATLGDIYKRVENGRIHKCPKCNGKGTITVEYNAYPKWLPTKKKNAISAKVKAIPKRSILQRWCKTDGR